MVSSGLNFEAIQSYKLTIRVEDFSGFSTTEILTVMLDDEPEPPVITNLPDIVSVSEGAIANTVIFTVTSWDPDNDVVIYSLAQAPDTGEFLIDATCKLDFR